MMGKSETKIENSQSQLYDNTVELSLDQTPSRLKEDMLSFTCHAVSAQLTYLDTKQVSGPI